MPQHHVLPTAAPFLPCNRMLLGPVSTPCCLVQCARALTLALQKHEKSAALQRQGVGPPDLMHIRNGKLEIIHDKLACSLQLLRG
jgi:hypothetical protein